MDDTRLFTAPFGDYMPGLWVEGALSACLEGMMIVLIEPTDGESPAMVTVRVVGGERDGSRSVIPLRIRVTPAFPYGSTARSMYVHFLT
jgi:hypothetical protein